jgi:FAD/FMN-containing dehydrogenase
MDAGLVRALGPQLDGALIDSHDSDYAQARLVFNGMIDRRPAAIVRARSMADVRRTVAAAGEAGSLLAVRCGGHSFPGFSTCDDGIVLDLSSLNRVAVDAERRIAEVGGGALLGDVDRGTARYGLVAPAGVVSHTGAGGLTLGGGMGWLSRRLGLTIDSLLSAEVCLADGRVAQVSEASEPELFWGIRGGGGNFGVVTRFVFRLHELGPVLVGCWVYPLSQMRTVLERYSEVSARAPRQLSTALTATAAGIRVTAFWSGSEKGAQVAVAPYGELGRTSSGSVGGVTFLDLQSRSDDHFCWGRRYYSKGGFFDAISAAAVSRMTSSIAQAPTPDCEIYVLQLGGAVADVADEATAYTGRMAGYYWIVEPVWDDPADDARCLSWGRETAAYLADLSMSGNYVNEQSDTGDDASLKAYGEEKYARLAALKHRFDPNNLFRLNQNLAPIPPSRRADLVAESAMLQVRQQGLTNEAMAQSVLPQRPVGVGAAARTRWPSRGTGHRRSTWHGTRSLVGTR